jgi:hypothetical protein
VNLLTWKASDYLVSCAAEIFGQSGTFDDVNDWFLTCLRRVFPEISVPP